MHIAIHDYVDVSGASVFLEKLILAQVVRKFPFREQEGSLPKS